MSKINIQSIVQKLDVEKIQNEVKNGQTIEETLKQIDLKPIIRDEMVKSDPNVTEEDIEVVVQNINLVEMLNSVFTKEDSAETLTGKTFEDLSMEEMELLQGAGDVDVEITPTITTSSLPCIGAVSAVSGLVLSIARC